MLTSLSSAVSGLDAFQQQMDIIGNNIANINTTGFKAATGNLVDSFSNTLQTATAASGTNGGSDPMQIGTGVTTGSITNDWSQGTLNPTNNANDLAINGNGFFVVQDPNNPTARYVTQDGTFTVNSTGNLVDGSGMQVVGYNGTTLSGTPGPITIDTTGSPSVTVPPSPMTGYSVNQQGIITVTQADGTTFTRGQILLQSFTNPQALTSVGNNLYANQADAGPSALTTPGASTGVGVVLSGTQELSNVNLSTEMANLIIAQRGFEANSKLITTSDELLQTLVNMKH